MRSSKKSRLTLGSTAALFWALLLFLLLGKGNHSTVLSASPSPTFSIYLPLIMRNFPIQTVFGAEMDQITSSGGLDQMAAANILWTRRNAVVWSSVESSEGTYNWSALASLESELQNASNKGIRVILIVRSTPEWARKIAGSGPYCGPIRQDKLTAFGNFMRALVARYSVPPYNVKYWEIWNEPDIDPSFFGYGDSIYGCWGDQNDTYYGGGYYAEMLKVVYPQIKAADPQSQVLVGGLLLDCDPRGSPSVCATVHPTDPNADKPPKFLEGILRHNGLNDGGNYFNGVSFHAYDYYQGGLGQYNNSNFQSAWNTTGPVVTAKVGFVQSVLSTYGVSGKFLMNTEAAILCDTCSSDSTFETTKAYYVAQVYAAAIAQGLRANVWYSVLGWRNSGLLDSSLNPRPAYTAFQFARSELRDAAYLGDVSSSDIGGASGVKGYKFNRSDRRIWVLWSLDGSAHTITLTSVPLAAWDALGNSVIPATSMNVNLNPLYLEWNP